MQILPMIRSRRAGLSAPMAAAARVVSAALAALAGSIILGAAAANAQ